MFQTFDVKTEKTAASGRISALRQDLVRRRLDAYVVPRTDAHQGEYVPACDERLAWLTGFSGSAGTAIVTTRTAALFVDGRYTVQAACEVEAAVIEVVATADTSPLDWLAAELDSGAVVGFDPRLFTLAQVERWTTRLKDAGIKLRPVAVNLVDRLWGKARPAEPAEPVRPHPIAFAGLSAAEKIAAIQDDLKSASHDAVVLTARESIAWLFNLRGADVAHTPVFSAYAIIHQRAKPELFVRTGRLTPDARTDLKGVAKVAGYDKFWGRLVELRDAKKTVAIDPASASFEVVRKLGGANRVARRTDPAIAPRARKNPTEIAGARSAHKRDGAAVARFLAWLDEAAPAGDVDEIAAATRLEEVRGETDALLEISFDTISGSGPNGAIVHYRVNSATNRKLGDGELYLVDSGAQYADGTTDITRTVAIGTPTPEMQDRFTRVLKGHIAVATARFPKGTRGRELDPFARRALWEAGLDFDHGTGHGVGSYLSVHEGPISISRMGEAKFEPGMIVSNEPGYYREGNYGIRIENLVLVREPEIPDGGDRPMMSFETLTLAPIDRRLIDASLLSPEERAWLDAYHARVLAEIGPDLDVATRRWLAAACAPL